MVLDVLVFLENFDVKKVVVLVFKVEKCLVLFGICWMFFWLVLSKEGYCFEFYFYIKNEVM